MRLFGLIGYPLSHSFSKKYFEEKFRQENIPGTGYELFPLKTIHSLPALLEKEKSLAGFNITIPYKQEVIAFLHQLDETAKEAGAVNTVKVVRDAQGKIISLMGFNTDVSGFENSLVPLLKAQHKQALVLGTGGASRAVQYVLRKLKIEFSLVSRTKTGDEKKISYEEIKEEEMKKHTLIINTTPLGMFPNTGEYPPLPYEYFSKSHLAYDLVYNPENTGFMKKAQAHGATVKNGLEMLSLQAEEAWKIWNRSY